jgi:uncharacterized protein
VKQQHLKFGITCGILSIIILGFSVPIRSTLAQAYKNLLLADSTVAPKSPVRGQKLPLTASISINNQNIQLEVARTPEEGRIGLMYRTELADDRGMLFVFEPAQPARFWMKNTLIPLDMIFIYRGVVQHIGTKIPPCKSDPCPDYGPERQGQPIDAVIELRGGRAAELKLKVGDSLQVRQFSAQNLK